jgi:ABC-type lipoprotein release transport system permease subunit
LARFRSSRRITANSEVAPKSSSFRLGHNPTASGLIAGILVALLLGRLLPSFSQLLYGVNATDAMTLLVVSGTLLGIATVAGYIPALRALKVDPIVALRCE